MSGDHVLLHEPQIKRALDAAKAGALGDIVSVDILRGAEYPPYEGGPLPPWYRDAGYPFRDAGAQGLSLIQTLLGNIDDVDADWRSLGGDPNLAFDKWHAKVRAKRGLANLQVTYSSPPTQSQLIIHGTKRALRVDLSRSKRALRGLVLGFYNRTAASERAPIAIEDAEIVRWADKVARAAEQDHAQRLAKFPLSETVPYRVTGAGGSLGNATVKRLREQGHRVRVFVRRMPETPQQGVEYAFGNLGDPVAVDRAVKGVEIVIHAGAAMKGGWLEHKGGTVVGTQNVVDACNKHGVKQLVHISSMSVIDWAGSSGNGAVSESTALEPRADERGAYTRAKLEAETIVCGATTAGLPAVILRPGQIFGGGIPLINGAVARDTGGRWLVLGDGKLQLPLVYIDDVVDAIVSSIDKKVIKGEVIQIIDPESLTQDDVLSIAGGNKPVIRVPRPIVFALGKLSELPLGAIGKPSPIGVYRLKSALARLHYESDQARQLLGWVPRVGVREGIRRVM
jgi:nucleoside-diphosphate-sugar epimerase